VAREGDLIVGVSVGERTAGIRVVEHEVLVFGSLDAGCGIVLDDERPASCVLGGRTVVGGLLPRGATSAVAIDASGREYQGTVRAGMYVIEAGEDGLWQDLVRFSDARGALVARALPVGRRRPVCDAAESCPLCAGMRWVTIENDVHCETCGFCVGEADLEDEPDEDEGPEPRPGDGSSEVAAFLASLPYSVYVGGGELTGGSFLSVGGGLPEEVVVQSGLLSVASGVRASRDLRWQLSMMLRETDPPSGRSAAARCVYADHQERAALRVVSGAGETEMRRFAVDGRLVRFSFLAVEDAWVATGTCEDVCITAWARELDPRSVAFQRLALSS
jgi:hypothetical protein